MPPAQDASWGRVQWIGFGVIAGVILALIIGAQAIYWILTLDDRGARAALVSLALFLYLRYGLADIVLNSEPFDRSSDDAG